MQVERKKLLGEALSAVRKAIREGETGWTHPPPPSWFRTCTANAGTQEIGLRRRRAVSNGRRSQGPPFAVFDLFFGRTGTHATIEVQHLFPEA